MKKLKLDHKLAEQVLHGQRTSTWRLYDDKDLSVNDTLLLIDKVVPDNPNTWRTIGVGTIDTVAERRLGDINASDMQSDGRFKTRDDMLAAYRTYYGSNVDWQTPVKMINFRFDPNVPMPTPKPDILPSAQVVTMYADGGSRGNPGPSASGYVIYDEQQSVLVNRGIYLGVTTNNQAEYTALKLGLEEARSLGACVVHVRMDSMLVVNQMRGVYKVKNRDLWPLHDAIKQLCQEFKHIDFTQVPRESNKLADAAVNAALDEHMRNGISPRQPKLRQV